MLLLLDIGNTHTHAGLANDKQVFRQTDLPTADWKHNRTRMAAALRAFAGRVKVTQVCVCSVVPAATYFAGAVFAGSWRLPMYELTHKTVRGVGIQYPRPETIGPDRLANAVAARHYLGAPALVVDFGTAVTFDVVDCHGDYVGGVIAPGLAAMTDYLHEKTALLPRVKIHDVSHAIGKNTKEAMCIGAVHGYRGLIRELITELKQELGADQLPVAATGGYAKLIARRLPEITQVAPNLTLEGLRLSWLHA